MALLHKNLNYIKTVKVLVDNEIITDDVIYGVLGGRHELSADDANQ